MLVYYGKLPAFGDFIRYNATSPEVQAMDQWMQEALYFAKRRLQPNSNLALKRAPVFHFFLSFKGTKNYITGLIKPSQDKVGRIYPFIVGLICSDSLIPTGVSPFLPVYLQTFYEEAGDFIDSASTASSADEIYEYSRELQAYIESMKPETTDSYKSYTDTTHISDFFPEDVAGKSPEEKNIIIQNIVSMSRYIVERDVRTLDFGFRFPLQPSPGSALYGASFWIELLYSRINGKDIQPQMFWAAGNSRVDSNLFLFFRTPSPNLYTYMIQSQLASDLIYRMDKDETASSITAGEHIPQQIRSLLAEGDTTLSTLLQSTSIS